MDYLTINGKSIPYPKKFEMKKAPNIVAELTTMSGKNIADVNGWKYANVTLEWGALYPEDLNRLILATADPSFTVTFLDKDGTTKTVNAILRSFKKAKTLVRYGDKYVWDGVAVELSFPDCYSY